MGVVVILRISGDDLDVARTAHREEIMLLQDLHRSVSEIKERLRLDEERIRLEREKLVTAEEAVRHQEERLRLTFDQLEINESRYQTKGRTSIFFCDFTRAKLFFSYHCFGRGPAHPALYLSQRRDHLRGKLNLIAPFLLGIFSVYSCFGC